MDEREESPGDGTYLDVSTDKPIVIDGVVGFCRDNVQRDIMWTSVGKEGDERSEVDEICGQVQGGIRGNGSVGSDQILRGWCFIV